jgi:sugar-specific transcriptional regulator TrmB
MEDVIVLRLRDVGFSLYEARLYVALISHGAQNGNEVAKRAAVPSSKVYAALDKLHSEGMVQTITDGSVTLWTALQPGELVNRLRERYNAPLDFLARELPKVRSAVPGDPFLTVTGEVALLEATKAIIDGAREELHISCWEAELELFRSALDAASARGVRVFGMLYGEGAMPQGVWLRHHYEEIVGGRVGGRLVAVVVDDAEALIARIPSNGVSSAVRSRNLVMTLIVQEYLHHDNMLQRAQLNFGLHEWDRWWQGDPDARAEILRSAMSADGIPPTVS